MSNDAVRAILMKHGKVDADQATFIQEQIDLQASIEADMRSYKASEVAWVKERDRLRKVLIAIREKCPHITTTYYNGSGNNDSTTTCNTCDKDL